MEFIEVELKDGRKFKFKQQLSFPEENLIKHETVELLGGYDKAVELQSAIEDARQKYFDYNVAKFGKEEFQAKQEKLFKLEEESADTEEYRELSEGTHGNKAYRLFILLVQEEAKTSNYAWLKVACVEKPKGFEFFEGHDEALLQELWLKVAVKRYEDKQAKETKKKSEESNGS